MNPLISIIVPVYNAEKYLDKCITSVLSQKYENLEVILINDGSTDKSELICNKFETADKRVKVIHKVNEGTSATRKAGINIARGDYITFVDSDDYIHEDMYKRFSEEINSKNPDIIQCGYKLVRENGEILKTNRFEAQLIEGKDECSLFFARKKNVTNYLWNKLFKRSLFENVEFPSLSLGEDVYIITQLFGNANRVITIPDAYYYYVMTEDSLVRKPFTVKKLDSIKAGKLMHGYYRKNFPNLTDYAAVYICSFAAKLYFHIGLTNLLEKQELKREMKETFNQYYSKELLKRHIGDISRNKWGLIKCFSISPLVCGYLFNFIHSIKKY